MFCLAKTLGLPFDDLEIVLMSIKFSSTWFVLSVWKKLPVLFSVFLGGRLVWTPARSRCTVKWDLGGFSGFSGWGFSHSWAPTFHQKVTSLDCKSGQDGNNSLAQNGWGSPWWLFWNRNLSKSPCIASMSYNMHHTLLFFSPPIFATIMSRKLKAKMRVGIVGQRSPVYQPEDCCYPVSIKKTQVRYDIITKLVKTGKYKI